jgi:hypothetical protein
MKQEISRFGRVLAGLGGVGDDGVKDTELVHVNQFELEILKALGGAGTVNHRTGLREFKYGADTKEGGATGRGSGAGSGSNGGGGGANDRDGGMRAPAGTGNGGYAGPNGVGGGTGPKASGAGNDVTITNKQAQKLGMTPDAYIDAARGLAQGVGDVVGNGDTIVDSILNGIAGIFGFNEDDIENEDDLQKMWDRSLAFAKAGVPIGSPEYDAHWGWDPVATALAVGGLVNPGISVASKFYSGLGLLGFDPPWTMDMGPRVFGSDTSAPTAAPTGYGAAALGGGQPGPSGAGQPGDVGGGGGGFHSIIASNKTSAPPSPLSPKPESKASPSVSSGPLPPGVSIIQPPVPIKNRDTGGFFGVPGSSFTGGYGNILVI